MIDTADLARFGRKIYSQAEEDGVTLEITRRLGLRNSLCVEIGVGGGDENNTRVLVDQGWYATWIGNVPIVNWSLPAKSGVFRQVWAEPPDITTHLRVRPVSVLSIDIDGNDYWIAERVVPWLQPLVVIVEYNAGQEGVWVMPYTPRYDWQPGQPFGCSLDAWRELLVDYELVYTSVAEVNAFFVHRSVVEAVVAPVVRT